MAREPRRGSEPSRRAQAEVGNQPESPGGGWSLAEEPRLRSETSPRAQERVGRSFYGRRISSPLRKVDSVGKEVSVGKVSRVEVGRLRRSIRNAVRARCGGG